MRTWKRRRRERAQQLQRIVAWKRGRASAFPVVVAATVAAAVTTGCGSEPSAAVPAGCLEGPSELRAALVRAPGEVRVGGRRPSEGFPRASSPGDVENLGVVFLTAAARPGRDTGPGPP